MAAAVATPFSGDALQHNFAVPAYNQVPETKEELEWADLVTLDLSQFDAPGGKAALAAKLFDALQNIGFFYVTDFGLTQDQVDRQFALGKAFFELPFDEKLKYRADLENGGYNGYKPLGLREVRPGIKDNIEIFNIPKFVPHYKDIPQPELIKANIGEIEEFARHIDSQIVRKLLTLFAIVLELPESTFLSTHRYDAKSDCHLRYMKYHARTPAENRALEDVWIKGHTDFGSLTLLFRQPVAALQVRTPEGAWRWVRPHPGSITVNVADALQFLTAGFLRSSVHRVVAPPPDQRDVDRLGVLYFVRPEDDLLLKPVQSDVLERLGYKPTEEDLEVAKQGITAGEWVKARVKSGTTRKAGLAQNELKEEEILKGVKAKYYD